MSRHPVDPAETMGPDPIDEQHQRIHDVVNNIEEDNDEDDNIEMQGYQQAIKHRQDGDNIEWKELPTGSYIKQLKDAWPNLHVVENSKHQKLFVFEGTKFLVPPGAIKEVLEVVNICHMGLDHNDGQFFRAMEWLMFFFRLPLPSMVFQWF